MSDSRKEWVVEVKRDGKWVTVPSSLLTKKEAMQIALLMKGKDNLPC